MPFLTRERGIWISAAAKEAAFGTPATLDSLIRIEAGNFIVPEYETIDDQDLLGATQEASSQQLVARAFTLAANAPRVPPHILAAFASYAMGKTTTTTPTGGTNARKHKIVPSKGSTELKTFTLGERFTSDIYRQYEGVGVDNFALSVQRQANRIVGLNSSLLLSELVTTGVTAPTASEIVENSINGNNSRIYLGEQSASFKGVTPDVLALGGNDIGLTDADDEITTQVNNLTWNFNNNINRESLYTLKSGLGFGAMRRGAPSQTLEMNFNFESGDLLTHIEAQAILALQLKIRGGLIEMGHYFGMNLIFPRLIISTLPPADNNQFIVETPTFRVLESPDRISVATGNNGATNAGGTVFTSAGATFTDGDDQVLRGDRVEIGTKSVKVTSVTDNTTLVVPAGLGNNLSGQTFKITRDPLPSVILEVWNAQAAYAA